MDEFIEEEDFYSEEHISELINDDEITPEEAGFMQGYIQQES
jgi:hypothetical protein